VCSPFAAESLTDPGGLVVLTSPDGTSPDAGAVERLASFPCVVLALDRPAGDAPPLSDATIEDGVATVDDILAMVEHNPVAATSLVLCLREAPPTLGGALVAESATYSLLQAGPEFRAWRAARPVREKKDDSGAAVRIERDGARLDLILNRPHVRNALNARMRDGLLEGLTLAAADPTVATVVLRGEGRNYSSGGDLDEFGSLSDPASAHMIRLTASIGRAIDALDRRIVAVVHGPCAGSGVELPAFARRVVARPDFTAALPEVALGLIPGAGGTASVTRRIGRHRMALLALSGAAIDATTSQQWGLVDEVTDEITDEIIE
jgi:enoyl-CoA hydratase/carnithine racemase